MSDADKPAELPQLKEMAGRIRLQICAATYAAEGGEWSNTSDEAIDAAINYHLAPLLAENERLRAEIAELRQPMTSEARVQTSEPKPDWRIGLTVKAKYRSDPLYYERGKVVDVHGSGFYGIDDKDGVLRIKLDSGNVILSASDKWVTA